MATMLKNFAMNLNIIPSNPFLLAADRIRTALPDIKTTSRYVLPDTGSVDDDQTESSGPNSRSAYVLLYNAKKLGVTYPKTRQNRELHMGFTVGQAYVRISDDRMAVVSEIRSGGREGLLRFADTGQEEWLLWIEFQQKGEWRIIGGAE